jgi:hypothetical protein
MLRSLRKAINPLSTGFTRWWCRSNVRATLDGKPRGTYKRLMPRPRAPMPTMDESVRRARIAAIERIMTQDNPAGPQP